MSPTGPCYTYLCASCGLPATGTHFREHGPPRRAVPTVILPAGIQATIRQFRADRGWQADSYEREIQELRDEDFCP